MTYKTEFEAIGTHWYIECVLSSQEDYDVLLRRVHERIAQFDKNYSRFRDDSLVSEMARHSGDYTLPEDAKPLLDLYLTLYALTDGAVTPLIGKTLEEAGYDAQYSLTAHELSTPKRLEEVLHYSYPTLTLKEPALLDFGAAGKGYLVDIISDLLKEGGAESGMVDAGGDIVVWGEPSRIGLENPANITEAIGIATVENASICGSAGNRRAWGQFHHIIDPHTLQSPKEILAVWATADTALVADALTTALYLVPAERLLGHFSFEYLILRSDYSIDRSAGFPAELFLQ